MCLVQSNKRNIADDVNDSTVSRILKKKQKKAGVYVCVCVRALH
jgi:hypothetical protein